MNKLILSIATALVTAGAVAFAQVPFQPAFDVQSSGGGGIGNVVEDATPELGGELVCGGYDITGAGVLTMNEQAAAEASSAGLGQLYVKTATPNELYFVDDAGTEFQLGASGGGSTHTGDVSFTTSGTVLKCDTTDGHCSVNDAADTSSGAGTFCLGKDSDSQQMCMSNSAASQMRIARGDVLSQGFAGVGLGGSKEYAVYDSSFLTRETAVGNEIMLEGPNHASNTGYIGWKAQNLGSAGADIRLAGIYVGATEAYMMAIADLTAFTLSSGGNASYRIGDMNESSASITACDTNLDGLIHFDHNYTTDTTRPAPAHMCVVETDGTSATYAYRTVVDQYAGAYVDTTITTAAYSSGWLDVIGGTPADDWTMNLSSGNTFDQQNGEITPLLENALATRYQVNWQVSFTGASSRTYSITVSIDDNEAGPTVTQQAQCQSMRSYGAGAAQLGSVSGHCIIELADLDGTNNDSVRLQWQADSGTDTIEIGQAQLIIRSL